jgi:hypothetical protein
MMVTLCLVRTLSTPQEQATWAKSRTKRRLPLPLIADSRSWTCLSGVLSRWVDEDRAGGHSGVGETYFSGAFSVVRGNSWRATIIGLPDNEDSAECIVNWNGDSWASICDTPFALEGGDGSSSSHGDFGLRSLLEPVWHVPLPAGNVTGVEVPVVELEYRELVRYTELGLFFWYPGIDSVVVTYDPTYAIVQGIVALHKGTSVASVTIDHVARLQ